MKNFKNNSLCTFRNASQPDRQLRAYQQTVTALWPLKPVLDISAPQLV